MDIYSKFSNSIYKSRKAHGYTQSQVAEAVSVNVRWYQKIESGERLPSSIVLIKLMILLDINVSDFREEVELLVPVSSVRRKNIQ